MVEHCVAIGAYGGNNWASCGWLDVIQPVVLVDLTVWCWSQSVGAIVQCACCPPSVDPHDAIKLIMSRMWEERYSNGSM